MSRQLVAFAGFGLALVLVGAFACRLALRAPQVERVEPVDQRLSVNAEPGTQAPANWRYVGTFKPLKIEDVTLEMFWSEDQKTFAEFYRDWSEDAAKSPVRKTFDDRKTLETIERALKGPPLRLALQEGIDGGTGGDSGTLGAITIRLQEGTFSLGLTPQGLTVDGGTANWANLMFSEQIADWVASAWKVETGMSLPPEFLDALSGASRVRRHVTE